jgi:hypothetical protein
MSRLLTPEEIEALRAGGPAASEPARPLRVGDEVEIVVDGMTLAQGRLISQRGRVCVRVEKLVTSAASGAKTPVFGRKEKQ